MPGWSFDLRPHGILDSRAVELINDQFYVFDGYDGRTSSSLSRAVFVLGVCCDPPGAPTASFNAAQLASPPRTVQFTDTSTGGPTSWSWDFGDGSSSTSQNPTHTYAAAGTYTVTLVATNADGSSAPVSNTITVSAPPPAPTASFTASPRWRGPPRAVQFTDTSTGGADLVVVGLRRRRQLHGQNPTAHLCRGGHLHRHPVATNATGIQRPGLANTSPSPRRRRRRPAFNAAPAGEPATPVQFTDTSTGGADLVVVGLRRRQQLHEPEPDPHLRRGGHLHRHARRYQRRRIQRPRLRNRSPCRPLHRRPCSTR